MRLLNEVFPKLPVWEERSPVHQLLDDACQLSQECRVVCHDVVLFHTHHLLQLALRYQREVALVLGAEGANHTSGSGIAEVRRSLLSCQ